MGEHYLDHEEEFPINSVVHCGQTPYKVGFEGATIDESPGKHQSSMPPGKFRNKFLPKVTVQPKK